MSLQRKLTCREFQTCASSVILGGSLVVPIASQHAQAQQGKLERYRSNVEPVCNFQASFMTWDIPYRKDPRPYARHNIPHGNIARIQLDALIDVIDRRSGKSERFVLIAPCQMEWVYAENRLFQLPSREYRNIYSLKEERSLARSITFEGKAWSAGLRPLPVTEYRRAPFSARSSAANSGRNRSSDNRQRPLGRTHRIRRPIGIAALRAAVPHQNHELSTADELVSSRHQSAAYARLQSRGKPYH